MPALISPCYSNEAPSSDALGLNMVLNFMFIFNDNSSILILRNTRFTNTQITKKIEEMKKEEGAGG